jgi:ubiquinone/menaquinone biosynthesis C-methylase UbiE
MAERAVADYADFLVPSLDADARVLDLGCGDGSLSMGLASLVGQVVGVDAEEEFAEAVAYAAHQDVSNVEFQRGDVYRLAFPDGSFDACLCHSVLEALDRPIEALLGIKRVLRPGGVLGVASVEYDGLILGGPGAELVREFYRIRQELWQVTGSANPYLGRELRGLLAQAGYVEVVATSKYICYGTQAAVRSFGLGRAEDCRDDWYAGMAVRFGLASQDDLDAMENAWRVWSEAPDAYAAFAWCRALGHKPE